MAQTQIASTSALVPVIVQRQIFLEQKKNAYFTRFFSAKGDMPVFEKTDFTKQKGQKMTFGLRVRLTGDPTATGNETVKGKEDKLTFYDFSIELERYRKAVKDDGAMTRQRFVGDIPTESRNALTTWGGEFIDQKCMDALVASPTSITYGGDATSVDTLEAGDKITPALISKMKAIALTQRSGGKTPLIPVNVDGKKYLVLLVSPDVAVDLKYDTTFMAAIKDAAERGSNNPLFSGMLGVWDGVVIHEHENVPVFSNGGGAAITYSKCVLMGASALCWAWGERPSIVEEDEDYKEFMGYCWRMTAQVGKPVFNSNDYGSLALYVADSRATGRTTNYA